MVTEFTEIKKLENKEYIKKTEARKLNNSKEYKTAKFAYGSSFTIFLIVFFLGFDLIEKTFNFTIIAVSLIYLFSAVIQYIIANRIKKEILKHNVIKLSTRLSGYILILLILSGNIFSTIAGFTLIKREKTIEYTLSIYMFITSICTILVSALNLFKEYVSNTFLLGMGLLSAISIFYIAMMILISKFVVSKKVDGKLLPLAIGLVFSSITGNIFALLVGVIVINKLMHKDKDISIAWIDILTRLFRNNMAVIGMFIVTFLLSLSICSYLTFDYSVAVENNYNALLLNPSLSYPFGTDNFGRCVFTRIVFGSRISLVVGIISTVVPMILGGLLGAASGYYGGKIDNVVMRALDVLYAVPSILLAIAIVASFGANTINLILALSVSSIPIYARTVRATVMGLSSAEFVEAARACGARDNVIILRHIIPNSLAPIIVRATMGIGSAVLSTSSMSYLGLGVEPHIPEWGNILKGGSAYLETNSYLAIFPGLAIILIVLAFNFFGDGLRDATDPKLK